MTPWQQLLLVWALAALAQGIAWRASNAAATPAASTWSGRSASAPRPCWWRSRARARACRARCSPCSAVSGARAGRAPVAAVRGEAEDGRYAALRERWGDAGEVVRHVPVPGLADRLVRAAVCCGGRESGEQTWNAYHCGPRHLAGQRRARRCRPPARPLPRGSRHRGKTCRGPAMTAASELFLRMVAPGFATSWRSGRLADRVAGVVRAGGDVRVPALDQRHPVDRAAGLAQPRRGPRPLPAQHPDADPVVPQ